MMITDSNNGNNHKKNEENRNEFFNIFTAHNIKLFECSNAFFGSTNYRRFANGGNFIIYTFQYMS